MAPQTVKDSLMLFPSGMITFKVTTKLVGGGDIMMNADSIPSGDLSRTSTVSADDSYSPGRAHLQVGPLAPVMAGCCTRCASQACAAATMSAAGAASAAVETHSAASRVHNSCAA